MVLLNAKFANEHSFKKFPNFSLENIDHRLIDSDEIAGENGLLVMFICNHCPYVKAIVKNIVQDVNDLKNMGINSVAINSNDATEYPEDSFEKMIEFAKSHNFSFPYLVDKTQKVAKEFGAGLIVQRELIIIAQYLTGKSRSSMGCSIKWRD